MRNEASNCNHVVISGSDLDWLIFRRMSAASNVQEQDGRMSEADITQEDMPQANGASSDTPSFATDLLITNKRGLHARASAKFVQLVEEFDAEIEVSKDSQTVGGTSIMGLMMLAASPGTTIHVVSRGRQAGEALSAISALVNAKFHEE